MYTFFIILFVIDAILLILLVLLQSSKSSGAELFGTTTQNVFGAQSGDILSKATTVLATIFLAGAFGIAVYQSSRPSILDIKLKEKEKQIKLKQQKEQQINQIQTTTNLPSVTTTSNLDKGVKSSDNK